MQTHGSMLACGVAERSGAVQTMRLRRPPSPGPGEILLDVLAAGVGAWDRLLASGEWDVDLRFPAALGVEGAGRVVAVGPGVSFPVAGDVVLAHEAPLPGHSGFWAEQVLVSASNAARLPNGLNPDRAAALPVNGLTARHALDWLKLSAGERLLVTNGAGGTGVLALQLAVAAGVIVTATASPRSFERLRQLGAEQVVDYHSETWTADLGEAFDAALATAPGTADDAARVVRPGGRLCSITSDAPGATEQLATTDLYVQPDASALAVLATQLRDGLIDLPIMVVPLAEGPAAFDRSTTGRTGGTKIVLSMGRPY